MSFNRLFWALFLTVITPMTLIGGFSFGWLLGLHWYVSALPAAAVWFSVTGLFVVIARIDAALKQRENLERAVLLLETRGESAKDRPVILTMAAIQCAEKRWGLGSQLSELHGRLLGETIARVELADRWAHRGCFNVRAPIVTIVTESGKVAELVPHLPQSTANWIVTPERTNPALMARAS